MTDAWRIAVVGLLAPAFAIAGLAAAGALAGPSSPFFPREMVVFSLLPLLVAPGAAALALTANVRAPRGWLAPLVLVVPLAAGVVVSIGGAPWIGDAMPAWAAFIAGIGLLAVLPFAVWPRPSGWFVALGAIIATGAAITALVIAILVAGEGRNGWWSYAAIALLLWLPAVWWGCLWFAHGVTGRAASRATPPWASRDVDGLFIQGLVSSHGRERWKARVAEAGARLTELAGAAAGAERAARIGVVNLATASLAIGLSAVGALVFFELASCAPDCGVPEAGVVGDSVLITGMVVGVTASLYGLGALSFTLVGTAGLEAEAEMASLGASLDLEWESIVQTAASAAREQRDPTGDLPGPTATPAPVSNPKQ